MKKVISLLLAVMMVLSLAACAATKPPAQATPTPVPEATPTPAPETPAPTPEPTPASEGESALTVLSNVWAAYDEDDKFAITGGGFEDAVMDAPGALDVADTDTLNSIVALPAASAALLTDAASMMHMMNANTFTCGAFHAANAEDAAALAQALKDSIQGRQWLCGFPDKLVVATFDSYVVSLFGAEELVNTFRDTLLAVYTSAEVVCDEAIL